MSEADMISRIDDLLAEERQAILSGDFEALAEIADAKESLAGALHGQRLARPDLARLRQAAERNGELLEATARGLRAVIRRLSEIRAANGPLRTYSRDGREQTIGSSGGALSRRA